MRDVIKLIVSLGVAGFFLWSAYRTVDLQTVLDILLRTRVIWLLAGTVCILLATYPRAYRWRILMAPIIAGAPIHKLFMAILVGYAGNNLIPRAGEVAKVWAIDRDPKRISGLLATVAVERLIDILALMMTFAAVAICIRGHLEEVFPWMTDVINTATLSITAATLLVLIASLRGHRLIDWLESRLHNPHINRILEFARSFLQGTEAIRSPSTYLKILFWTVLLNVAYVGALALHFEAFDFGKRYGLGLLDALVVTTISTIGIVIPTPGGTGTYHYFSSRALHGLYGVPLEEALAFATVVHGLIYVAFLITGGPGLISLIWRKRASAPEST